LISVPSSGMRLSFSWDAGSADEGADNRNGPYLVRIPWHDRACKMTVHDGQTVAGAAEPLV